MVSVKGTSDTKVQGIQVGDSASSDAFGRLRVANPVNLFSNKNIHTKNTHLYEEPLVGVIIVHGAVTGGPFVVGETVTGGTSGSAGTVTIVNAGSLTVSIDINHNDFIVAETITGGTSGATAAVTTNNTGSNISHIRNEAAVELQVGKVTNDQAVRQTHRYFSYRPGKSHRVDMSFIFGAAVTNIRRRSGYFDLDNGYFLEQTSTGVSIVRRTKTSGAVVDSSVTQSNWNLDTMDGTGNSGITLDFSKIQILLIDMQWLGAGRVRIGFELNGQIIYCHEFNFSNILSTVHISTPSLPIRHEITNTGGTAAVQTMKEICTSVVSEGGSRLSGIGLNASNGSTSVALTSGVLRPLLAIRLKNVFSGGDNRRTVEFVSMGIFSTTKDIHYQLVHVHEGTVTGGAWSDADEASGIEVNSTLTSFTGEQHIIQGGYLAGGKGTSAAVTTGEKLDDHNFIFQNYNSTNSEMFVIVATALGANSTAYAHINWIEYD